MKRLSTLTRREHDARPDQGPDLGDEPRTRSAGCGCRIRCGESSRLLHWCIAEGTQDLHGIQYDKKNVCRKDREGMLGKSINRPDQQSLYFSSLAHVMIRASPEKSELQTVAD